MKKTLVLRVMVLTLLFHLPVLAQDTDVCMQDLSIFAEFAKVKNYKSAFQPWMKVRTSCPSINAAVYSYGERILKDLIKNGTPEEVASAKEDIIKLYGEWIEYFPKRRNKSIIGDVISKKAQALLDFKIGTLKDVTTLLIWPIKKILQALQTPNYCITISKHTSTVTKLVTKK